MIKKRLLLFLRFAVAIILVQTLRFKFTAHPDSVYIFETIGLEPYGRIGTGILELIAGILLLIPKTVWAGALLTIGLMTGAILMHLTQIGIEVNNDKGVLFITAVVTLVIAAVLLLNFKKEIPFIGSKL
ncbi:MAG: DoxX family protein [Bacteroidia bacterium]|nr:DoxX family protein [Bacteroidia bacterium]NNK59600.1 DoxX family protein [Flavobacteriaceae bacterium]